MLLEKKLLKLRKSESLVIIGSVVIVIGIFLLIYPNIEFYNNGYLYMMSYKSDFIDSEDFEKLEEEMCYNELYAYNKEKDISILSWDYEGFLFFKWFKVKYQKGNICETEFLLEESYIKHFLKDAEIIENKNKVNLGELIKGKEAIVSNKRYPWNDKYKYIEYKLDGKRTEMFISTDEDGLLIIQVGSSDESPKYIAYKWF